MLRPASTRFKFIIFLTTFPIFLSPSFAVLTIPVSRVDVHENSSFSNVSGRPFRPYLLGVLSHVFGLAFVCCVDSRRTTTTGDGGEDVHSELSSQSEEQLSHDAFVINDGLNDISMMVDVFIFLSSWN